MKVNLILHGSVDERGELLLKIPDDLPKEQLLKITIEYDNGEPEKELEPLNLKEDYFSWGQFRNAVANRIELDDDYDLMKFEGWANLLADMAYEENEDFEDAEIDFLDLDDEDLE